MYGRHTIGVVFLSSILALPAVANDLYLNGVNINGLKNQEFKDCTVNIDASGNVWISAKGYTALREAPPETGKPAAAVAPVPKAVISKHYWLAAERRQGKGAGYDVDLFVNDKWVRKVKSSEDQIVTEITDALNPGTNSLKIVAQKSKTVQGDPGGTLSLIIGEGISGNNSLVIERPIVEYKRTAEETEPFVNEYTMEAR